MSALDDEIDEICFAASCYAESNQTESLGYWLRKHFASHGLMIVRSPSAPVHMHGRHFTEPGPVVVDTPDPRDAALKLARDALLDAFTAEGDDSGWMSRKLSAAIAAIDAITGGGNAD